MTAKLASARATSASSPPIVLGPAERVEIVFDAQHRRRVDGLALENAFAELAARGQPEDFRQRPGGLVGFQPLDGARRQDQHAMRALAAQHLLPGEGDDIEFRKVEALRERRRGGVANGQSAAVGRNEIGIGNAHARGRAVPGEHHVAIEIDRREIGQPAVVGFDDARVGELELLHHIGDPAGAKTFPGDHVDAARAEQRPQRHLDGAGVGGRHDADPVVGRHLKDFAGELDRPLELGLADTWRGASGRARKYRALQATIRDAWRKDLKRNWDLPGALPAWVSSSSWSILPDSKLLVGEEWPTDGVTASRLRRQEECLCRSRDTRPKSPRPKKQMADRGPPFPRPMKASPTRVRSAGRP